MSIENRPILPELVAAKLDKARNFENPAVLAEMEAEPRLGEMLWFLQWVSQPKNYPGGLARFAADLVDQSMDFLTTPTMKAHAGKPYTEAVKQAILEELPRSLRWDREPEAGRSTPSWELSGIEAEERRRKDEDRKQKNEADTKARHLRIQEADVLNLISGDALERLAQYLEELCEKPAVRFRRSTSADLSEAYFNAGVPPRNFPQVAEAILRFMDRWRGAELAKIAETAITRQCFAWLEKAARLPGRGVMIEGNSRFGKTDAIRAWCQAHPGRARFIRTPPAGGEAELLRAVASALGIDRSFRYRALDLRAEIEFVLLHSGLMLIFDESQFIFPASFSKNTTPARLNWIRCNLLDAGCPVVFIYTPQSYRSAKSKFVKATGLAIEQWEGRILKTVLPSEVPREDLLAIARIHFRGVDERCVEWLVSMLAATERNYVSDVSNVATLAFFNAELAGRTTPKLADIKAALADVLPPALSSPPATSPDSAKEAPALAPFPRSRRPSAPDFQRPCTAPERPMHDRGTDPAQLMPGAIPLERFDAAAIDLASPA